MNYSGIVALLLCFCTAASCTKVDNGEVTEAHLIFRYHFDSTQERLDREGKPASLANGHAAQNAVVKAMSTDYIELAVDAATALGNGVILYRGAQANAGGETAIDFAGSVPAADREVFFAIPLKDIPAGSYEWLRLSGAYQHSQVKCHVDTTVTIATDTSSHNITISGDFSGTAASFIGYNTYIKSFPLQSQSLTVDANRKQGYWGFETTISGEGFSEVYVSSGQSPEGSTTVVNAIYDTSPVPPGSDVMTAAFVPGKLVITGKETENIIVEVSLSTNKSFEWQELINNGKWDPLKGEPVVDMGIRGMIPSIK